MAKKTLGYVEMEWVCPRCGGKNPGSKQTCTTCGGPQPRDVKFQQREGQELIKDEEAQKIAAAGPDVHCAFCGTRNPSDAKICIQCGADLTSAEKRESGQVVGAYSSTPAPEKPCPNCGHMNPGGALRCSNCGASMAAAATGQPVAAVTPAKPFKLSPVMIVVGIIGIIGLIILCIVLASALFKTETVTGQVEDRSWTTVVVVEQFQSINRQGWADEIPSGAQVGACEFRYSYTSSEPQPNSTEVCGTPYTVDQGSGFGEVVQDCSYETYAEFCEYTVEDWVAVDQLRLQGDDLNPRLPDTSLASNERTGDSSVVYSIWFNTDMGTLEYQTSDLKLYQLAQFGSEWSLEINGSGEVVAAEPLQ